MSGKVDLYEQDFVRWTEAQAAGLRRAAETRSKLPLDWLNLAEEVESLGRSQRRELRSRLATIIEHLLKLEYSPATEPRIGWLETIGRERREIERLLEDSPSLGGELEQALAAEWRHTASFVAEVLERLGELPAGSPFPSSRPATASSKCSAPGFPIGLRANEGSLKEWPSSVPADAAEGGRTGTMRGLLGLTTTLGGNASATSDDAARYCGLDPAATWLGRSANGSRRPSARHGHRRFGRHRLPPRSHLRRERLRPRDRSRPA